MRNVSLLNADQLETKEILLKAIKNHYGKRDIPKVIHKVFPTRHDIFESQFLDSKVHEFFAKAVSPDKAFDSNVHDANLPDNKIRVLAGLQILQSDSTGTGGVDAGNTLPEGKIWVPSTDAGIASGIVNCRINNNEVLIDQQVESWDIDDGIPSFMRFARLVVQEANEAIELSIKFNAVPVGNKHLQMKFFGWLLQRQ